MNKASLKLRKRRSNKLHPSKSFIKRTQNPTLEARKHQAADEELKNRVTEIENTRARRWHPTGKKWYSPLKILLGFFHPAFRNTHRFLQPDKQEDIVDMIESYLGMLTLFYSLVGVAAVEISMSPLEVPEAGEDSAEMILSGISRFGWFALGPICLTCVAAGIHVLWSIQAVPVHRRRSHMLKNQLGFSMPYAFAPLCFLLLHISMFSGCAASVARAETTWLQTTLLAGMCVGFIPVFPLVYASGAMVEDAFRPWWQASKDRADEKRQDGVGDEENAKLVRVASQYELGTPCEELRTNLGLLGLQFCQELIELEGLTWTGMCNIIETTSSFLLLDRMLSSAGVVKAGHRSAIMLQVQKDISRKAAKREIVAGGSLRRQQTSVN